MARIIVGVLRGGNSSEYDLSLKSGAALIAALPEERYEVRDILVDKYGAWHSRGVPMSPARALQQVDVVLSALHGGMGEDGTVQRILSQMGIPYAGSRGVPSALSLHKVRAREVLEREGISMPRAVSFSISNPLTTAEMAHAVFSQFGPPYVVKPVSEGSSHGIRIAHSIVDLPDAIGDVIDAHGTALVEEFIRGIEVTIGLLEGFRNQDVYAFPPAEVRLPKGDHYIRAEQYRNSNRLHRAPAALTHEEKEALIALAKQVHTALGLSHVSQTDIILTKHGPYVLEINASPLMYEGAAFPHMLSVVGSNTCEMCEHMIGLAKKHHG